MTQRLHLRVLHLAIVLLGAAGCASTQEYAGFAVAGSNYAAALDRLLVASRDATVDATSNRLLQDDALTNLTLEQYRQLADGDRSRLEVIEGLRLHADLLGRYFRTLSRLTDSSAPAEVKNALASTVAGLNGVSRGLHASGLLSDPAKAAIGAIGEVVIAARIRGALREELQMRQTTLRRELALQEELLAALGQSIAHDLLISIQAREGRDVIAPLRAEEPIADADRWVATRRSVLLAEPKVAELQNASRAAKEMREAFEDLLSGRLSGARLNGLVAELDPMIAIAEHLMRAG
jgi:hypothetical protein